MKFSLKSVLIVSFSAIIAICVSMIALSSYYSSKTIMSQHSLQIMENISDFALDKSKTYMIIARDAAELTRQLESRDVVNSENIRGMLHYFYEQLKINKQFSGIYYGNDAGDFLMLLKNEDGYMAKQISYDAELNKKIFKTQYDFSMNEVSKEKIEFDSYDPRVRPWFVSAKAARKLVWTEPYVFYTSQKPGITTAAPIYDKDTNLKGVVGVDIEIDSLSSFISNLKISENGKVFIMAKSLKMISFPITTKNGHNINNKPRLLKIDEIEDNVAKQAYQELLKKTSLNDLNKKVFLEFNKDSKNYTAMFLPFNMNDIQWVIGMYAPEDDYLGLLKENQIFNIVLTILIGLFAIYVAYIISEMIAKPISRLENMAHDLKDLKLNTPCVESSSLKEIDEAINSFNSMKNSLRSAYVDTLHRLALASEYKDMDTAEHIKRIGLASEVIGKKLNLDSHMVYVLKHASTMHDVGKLGIADDILLKPSKLTPEERVIMQVHSEIGASILSNPTSEIMAQAQEISLYHHEKWDGSGYPKGLQGDEIPLCARIVAVVDVFDALCSKRCYKNALPFEKAKSVILKGSGKHFDPGCVEAFNLAFDEILSIYKENS